MDIITDGLLRDIDAFLLQHRISTSKFGQLAVKDHKLYARLRAGGVTTTTVTRVRAFMEAFPGREADARDAAE